MANDLWQVLGEPIEIILGGMSYKARMIPIRAVFGWAERRVVSDAMANLHAVAAGLSGREKVEYLAEATKRAVPTGDELRLAALENVRSVDAIRELLFQALHKDQPSMTREQVNELVEKNADEIDNLLRLLIQGLPKGGSEGNGLPEGATRNPPPG
ncbi:MAG: hypothetical protein PHY31_04515 [Smithellaceae bacterium]|nr:hypothetical protein [Smithellaceae bacterium]